MRTENIKKETTLKLPQTPYIDTYLGLKYCNNNRALYLKVLHNFVKKYQYLNLNEVENRERTVHALKGITATLGMTTLTECLVALEISSNSTLINRFQHELVEVVKEIIALR